MFDADPKLPDGSAVVDTKDYKGSGFDRGHICPHSDRSKDQKSSYATFVMTNIIPQAPNVNQKAWNQLEMYCRDLVERKNSWLYILFGPAGNGGRGSQGFQTAIGPDDKVTVPSLCWKIVVLVPEAGPGTDLERIDADTRVIAVVVPNDSSVGFDWAQYRTSVRAIEKKTKLKFFTNLPPEVAKALKEEPDETPIPPPTPVPHGK